GLSPDGRCGGNRPDLHARPVPRADRSCARRNSRRSPGSALPLGQDRDGALSRRASNAATTKSAQPPAAITFPFSVGKITNRNPLPLIGAEKLDTPKGVRHRQNPCRRPSLIRPAGECAAVSKSE